MATATPINYVSRLLPSAEDWLIYDLVIQAIRPSDSGEYFSEFIGAFARALRHCCMVGLMQPFPGYENSVEDEDRVFAALKTSAYGVCPVHDPQTCWWCRRETVRLLGHAGELGRSDCPVEMHGRGKAK